MEKKIFKILKKIKLKDLLPKGIKGDLISLNSLSKIIVKNDVATFAIDVNKLGIGNNEQSKILEERCKEAVLKGTDLTRVNVILTADLTDNKEPKSKSEQQQCKSETVNGKAKIEPDNKSEKSENYRDPIAGVKKVIAVASGKGGVGKSTVSVNLAISLKKIGFKVALLDADIYGPSIPHMMNLQGKPELKNGLMLPLQSYGIDCMSIGLMVDVQQALVWRGPMVTKTLQQLIRGTNWHDIDYLIVDLPPGTGDAHLSMAQKFPLDGVVIVSTPQEVATIDAVKSIDMFKQLQIPILGVVQNMSYLMDEKSGEKTYLFGCDGAKKMAEKMSLNFLGEIPLESKVREAGDNREPITHSQPSCSISFKYGEIAENIVDSKDL